MYDAAIGLEYPRHDVPDPNKAGDALTMLDELKPDPNNHPGPKFVKYDVTTLPFRTSRSTMDCFSVFRYFDTQQLA